jgi:hypothetical protein
MKDLSLSHKVIYIQQRLNHDREAEAGFQKRKKAVCTSPIGSDFSMIDKVTTIDQTGCSRLIYVCKDLHARLHGSINCMDITNNGIIYEFVGITNTTLSLTTTDPSNVAKAGDVIVVFDNAAFF